MDGITDHIRKGELVMRKTLCALALMATSGATVGAGYDASVDLQPQFEEINKTLHEQRNNIRKRYGKEPIKYKPFPKWDMPSRLIVMEKGDDVGVNWKTVNQSGDVVRLVGVASGGKRVEATFRKSNMFVTGGRNIEVDGQDHNGNPVKIEIDAPGSGSVRRW